MITSVSCFVFLLRSVYVAGDCIVRMHRFGDCANTGDDVIMEWNTNGEKEMFFYWKDSSGGGYSGNNDKNGHINDKAREMALADRLENWTSAFSFDGDCEKIEVFDEDAMPKAFWGPEIREDAIGYADNCVVINGRLKNEKECFWACNGPHGCPGKVKNCVNFRNDLNDDVGGFIATAVCEGCSDGFGSGMRSVSEQRSVFELSVGGEEVKIPVNSALLKSSTVWVSGALLVTVVSVVAVVYRRRKTAEYDEINKIEV